MNQPSAKRLLTEANAGINYAPKVATTQAQQTRTVHDLSASLAAVTPAPFAAVTTVGPNDVIVNPGELFQELLGGGAAITDSAAYNLTVNMSSAQRSALLTELFSPTGCNWSTVRIGLGATDFQSGSQYTYDDMPASQTDAGLSNFTVKNDQARIIPVLQQIFAINPRVRVFASVWGAPGWMLSSGSSFGNAVIAPANYATYANYIVKAIQAYASYGIPIYAVAPMNEPYVPTAIAASVSVQQAVIQALGAAFDAAGLDVKILGHDDNWPTGSPATLAGDPATAPYLAGIAWHGYLGSPVAMSQLRRQYPSMEQHLTEWRALQSESAFLELQGMAGGFIAQGIRNWARSVTLWNLALDQTGAPYTTNTGRRGVVTVNNTTGAVTRNGAYYALTHLTKFLQPGARRCKSSTYSPTYTAYTTYPIGVTTVAWVNPDGSIGLYAYNGSASATTFQVIDGRTGQGFPVTLNSGEVSTFTWGTSAQTLPAGTPPTLTVPSMPTVTATGGNGQANLSWTAPSTTYPITGYTVLRGSTAGTEIPVASLPASATSFLDYLAAGSYSYKLQATSLAGAAISASTAATVTSATVPATPTITVSAIAGAATVSWGAVTQNGSDVTGYQVLRSTSSGTETLLATSAKGSTSYVDTTVSIGTTYYYKVIAVNATGSSPASNEASVLIPSVAVGTTVTAQNATLTIGNSLTWSHTVGSNDKVLVVLLAASSGINPTVTGVTAGGVAMTRQTQVDSDATSGLTREVDIYTLSNPTAGATSIVVATNASNSPMTTYSVGATSVSVVGGTGSIGTAVTTKNASTTSLSVTTTSSSTGIVLAAAAARSSVALTVGGGQTALRNDLIGTNMAEAHTVQAGGTSQTTSASWTTADRGSLAAIGIS